MPGLLWWVQVFGGVVGLLLMVGSLLAAVYSTFRDAPRFVRRLTGVNKLETKVDQLLADHLLSQRLQQQQAEAFNELKETVCEEHDIPEGERPDGMDTKKIREELLGDDEPDFTRGGGDD